MKNAKNNMKRGLWQDLNGPCLTITSHLAKTSINSRDPVLLVDPEKELYRRFTPREAARIQSFPENFLFPVSQSYAYKQIGNAVPPVFMWHIANALQKAIESVKTSNEPIYKSYKDEEFWSDKNWVQLSLFEPRNIYISRQDRTLMIGQCRQGTKSWIMSHQMYNYPITETEIKEHPELLSIKRLLVMHRLSTVGFFKVIDSKIVDRDFLKTHNYPTKSSRHKATTKYILYILEGCGEEIPTLDIDDLKVIMGKGIKL